MQKSLNGGAVHISIPSIERGLELCKFGNFDSLALSSNLVQGRSSSEVQDLLAQAGVAAGAMGVPFDWRVSEEAQNNGLAALPAIAKSLADVGVTRCGTWILPGSNDKNWDQNWAFHIRRLTPIAEILNDHGISLGIEYVGPKTARDSFRHPFAYTLQAMHHLANLVGHNCGLLVDLWHVHSSEGNLAELALVDVKDIVLVHLNDAPAGVDITELIDNQRRLPCATGVVDTAGFMATLRKIGYAGPCEAEPFDNSLKELASDEERALTVGKSMDAAFNA